MAFNNNIEIWQPEKISNKEVSIIKELNPDIIIVVSWAFNTKRNSIDSKVGLY